MKNVSNEKEKEQMMKLEKEKTKNMAHLTEYGEGGRARRGQEEGECNIRHPWQSKVIETLIPWYFSIFNRFNSKL